MNLLQWSFHIRDVGVEGLESLTFSQAQLQDQILSIKQRYHCDEVFYLATCNRVEFLLASKNEISNKSPDFTQHKAQIKTELSDIISYWLKVCCSLDSIVFGENQIIGQVKRAFIDLQKSSLAGPLISQFMNYIFRESKWIRNHSNLSRIQTSVSAVAAKKIISEFSGEAKILLVGFGETNQLVYKYLQKKQKFHLSVTNRTLSKVEAGIDSKTQIIPWGNFASAQLEHYDVVVLAVAGQKFLLNKEKMSKISPKMVLDLSVPANAEEKLVKTTATYVGLNEIKTIVEANKEASVALISEVETLVLNSTQKIIFDLSKKSLDKIITSNIQLAMDVHTKTFFEHEDLLKDFSPEQLETIKLLSEKLIKKINHIHLKSIKQVYSDLTKPTGN